MAIRIFLSINKTVAAYQFYLSGACGGERELLVIGLGKRSHKMGKIYTIESLWAAMIGML